MMTDTAFEDYRSPLRAVTQFESTPIQLRVNGVINDVDHINSNNGTGHDCADNDDDCVILESEESCGTKAQPTETIAPIPSHQANSNAGAEASLPNQSSASPRVYPIYKFGPYVPILIRNNEFLVDPRGMINFKPDEMQTNEFTTEIKLNCEVFPEDALLEAPSLVTPLLLKKKTLWPPRYHELIPYPRVNHQTKDQTDSVGGAASSESNQKESSPMGTMELTCNVSAAPIKHVENHSQNSKSTVHYVENTTLASLKANRKASDKTVLSIADFHKTSVGNILLSIGLSRVNQHIIAEDFRKLKSKVRRTDDNEDMIRLLESKRKGLVEATASNRPYETNEIYRCSRCKFTTEFLIVLEGHLESSHMNSKRDFLCNWCDFKTKDANQIIVHCLSSHNKRYVIDRPLSPHCCHLCPYECKSKRQLFSHITKCRIDHLRVSVLAPDVFEVRDFPAITSKCIEQKDVSSYEQTLRNLRLAAYNPHQLKILTAQQKTGSILIFPRNIQNQNQRDPVSESGKNSNSVGKNPLGSSVNVLNNDASSATLSAASGASYCVIPSQPNQNVQFMQVRSDALQYPLTNSSFVNSRSVIREAAETVMGREGRSESRGLKVPRLGPSDSDDDLEKSSLPDSSMSSSNHKSSTFVICEICDGYIKDLSQLRSHMEWIHKVKIHPRLLESRPPLNCQKCQWRFFTDQGLERHLLGIHGLVTSNMQELADQNKDSGRCTICGRAYPNQLVAHMRDIHRANLKTAHLSYKCTICSSTFNLYRLFENHVYTLHADAVKRRC